MIIFYCGDILCLLTWPRCVWMYSARPSHHRYLHPDLHLNNIIQIKTCKNIRILSALLVVRPWLAEGVAGDDGWGLHKPEHYKIHIILSCQASCHVILYCVSRDVWPLVVGKLDSGSEALATVYIQTEGLHSDVLHRVSMEWGHYEYGQYGQYGHCGHYGQYDYYGHYGQKVTWCSAALLVTSSARTSWHWASFSVRADRVSCRVVTWSWS